MLVYKKLMLGILQRKYDFNKKNIKNKMYCFQKLLLIVLILKTTFYFNKKTNYKKIQTKY